MATKSRSAELAAKRRYWKKQIESWQESGLTQTEYCHRNNLKKHQLTYWKKKFITSESAVSFVQLQVNSNLQANELPTRSPLHLIIHDHYRIQIERGFDPIALQQLIFTLSRL
jgi:hypothetical protein